MPLHQPQMGMQRATTSAPDESISDAGTADSVGVSSADEVSLGDYDTEKDDAELDVPPPYSPLCPNYSDRDDFECMPSTRNPSPVERRVLGGLHWTRSRCHRVSASQRKEIWAIQVAEALEGNLILLSQETSEYSRDALLLLRDARGQSTKKWSLDSPQETALCDDDEEIRQAYVASLLSLGLMYSTIYL